MKAFILLVTKGDNSEIMKSLNSFPCVLEAHRLYGDYDIIVKVKVQDIHELSKLKNKLLNESPALYAEVLIIEEG
ncbi:hypothetical protein OCC_07381 [Thermococcus litoralis DSM 5473]|uniref:Transcription regulator AsnC/Lrp ligand binding domain-containing protein n=1 Tax=Thermococcus litoralis (strain ATCC 51850 / DSM 5473 / JCM 8560 / NS-C) TaxID=523849 RepID=H3ZL43_THELN|nr:Lrp/AsnC ligand binding domain-containing protein [Thermococcus litoralis]EHR79333.1 hypothetical protein OCC_07381 [Thermococcus litoralis DSM 5473]